jgi:FixJ family two-component response regulator
MKGGATEFLLKPFDEDDLVRAIDAAIAFDRRERAEEGSLRDFKSRYATLTPREREVFPYVIAAGGLRPGLHAGT